MLGIIRSVMMMSGTMCMASLMPSVPSWALVILKSVWKMLVKKARMSSLSSTMSIVRCLSRTFTSSKCTVGTFSSVVSSSVSR